jgi:putative permease
MTNYQSASNRALLYILIAGTLFIGVYALRHTVSCFLLSFVIAYLLDPFVVFFERRKYSRISGIICLYIILGLFSIFFFSYFVPFMILSWKTFVPNIPLYIMKIKALGQELEGRYEPAYGADEWSWIFAKIMSWVDKLLTNLGNGVYAAASRMVFNLFNLVLSPILVYFMLYYKETIRSTTAAWLPAQHRDLIIEVGREINDSIGGYIKGQIIVSFIVAVLSSITLIMIDVDYPILNGIFAGLASVLPFIGVIIATLPPLFFAYVKFQSGFALIKVTAAFAMIYFLEGYLVKPLVFKRSMDLNPLVTIIVVMAFGELLGFWGIVLALPLAAAIKIMSVHLRRGDFDEYNEP